MKLRIDTIDYSGYPIAKGELIFEEGESEVEITFDDLQSELLDTVDCYNKTYLAIGYDKEGNKYSASAIFSCDELVELEDIIFEEHRDEKMMKQLYDAEVRAGIYDPKNPHETLEQKIQKGYNLKRYGIDYDV